MVPTRADQAQEDLENLRAQVRLPNRSRPKVPIVFDGLKSTAEVWERDTLRTGEKHRGPAVVTEYSATTLIPPGKRFWVDQSGNLLIELTG